MRREHNEPFSSATIHDRIKIFKPCGAETSSILGTIENHVIHQDEPYPGSNECRVRTSEKAFVCDKVPVPARLAYLRLPPVVYIEIMIAWNQKPGIGERIQRLFRRSHQVHGVIHKITEYYCKIDVFPLSQLLIYRIPRIAKFHAVVHLRIPNKSHLQMSMRLCFSVPGGSHTRQHHHRCQNTIVPFHLKCFNHGQS